MATIQERLAEYRSTNSSAEAAMLVISEDFREVSVPDGEKILGCVGDKDTRRVWFTGPAECDGTDLTGYTWSVMYYNAADEGDRHMVSDLVDNGDGTVTFSWKVGATAYARSGDVSISVNAEALDGEDVENAFNTTLFTMRVLPSNQTGLAPDAEMTDTMTAFIAANQAAVDAAVGAAEAATAAASASASSANTAASTANARASDAQAAASAANTAAQHAEEAAEAAVTNVKCYYTTEESGDDTVLALVYDLVTE